MSVNRHLWFDLFHIGWLRNLLYPISFVHVFGFSYLNQIGTDHQIQTAKIMQKPLYDSHHRKNPRIRTILYGLLQDFY